MKYYVVIYVDSRNEGSAITKGHYESLSEAEENLKSYALEFVRLDGGERQERVAFQNGRSLNEIKIDITLNNGIYLQEKDDKNKMIYVYEKTTRNTGYLFSGVTGDINKLGVFSITEIDFNVPERFSCGCNKIKSGSTYVSKLKEEAPLLFVDELRNIVSSSSGFNLKPARRRRKNVQDTSIVSIVNEISRSV